MARVKPGELRKRKHATKLTPEVVDALATVGEIADALRRVFGEHDEIKTL